MHVRLLCGTRAGTVSDIPMPSALAMLADGRAERLDVAPVVTPVPVDVPLASPHLRDDRRAVGLSQRRRR